MNPDHTLLQTRNRMLTQRQNCNTLYLATQNADGSMESSHAPCLYFDDSYWLYISSLTAHTRNIQRTNTAGILIIESEEAASNAFARQRQSLQCETHEEPRSSDMHTAVLDAFTEKFGETVSVMRQLSDFSLYRLILISGRYIEGFGRAYTLSGKNLCQLDHIGPDQIKAEQRSTD